MDALLEFIDKIVSESDEMKRIFQSHIADQDELLPHALLGDITRALADEAERGQLRDWHAKLLRALDEALAFGNPEVGELIGVSFAENLCGETRAISVLWPHMGDALRREVRNMCGAKLDEYRANGSDGGLQFP